MGCCFSNEKCPCCSTVSAALYYLNDLCNDNESSTASDWVRFHTDPTRIRARNRLGEVANRPRMGRLTGFLPETEQTGISGDTHRDHQAIRELFAKEISCSNESQPGEIETPNYFEELRAWLELSHDEYFNTWSSSGSQPEQIDSWERFVQNTTESGIFSDFANTVSESNSRPHPQDSNDFQRDIWDSWFDNLNRQAKEFELENATRNVLPSTEVPVQVQPKRKDTPMPYAEAGSSNGTGSITPNIYSQDKSEPSMLAKVFSFKRNATDDEAEQKILQARLARLFEGSVSEPRSSKSEKVPRLSEMANLEIRLQMLQRPLNPNFEQDGDDDETNAGPSSEIDEILERRLKALGSDAQPIPCDLETLRVPDKETELKKRLSEERHVTELKERLDLLSQPLRA